MPSWSDPKLQVCHKIQTEMHTAWNLVVLVKQVSHSFTLPCFPTFGVPCLDSSSNTLHARSKLQRRTIQQTVPCWEETETATGVTKRSCWSCTSFKAGWIDKTRSLKTFILDWISILGIGKSPRAWQFWCYLRRSRLSGTVSAWCSRTNKNWRSVLESTKT